MFFNIARIEEAAVKDGKFKTTATSKVPVVDGTKANKDAKTALTAYVSVPKNPHGVNASPDGRSTSSAPASSRPPAP